jgi:hypothetical protein
MKMDHLKDYLRWDIFEENVIVYLLDKMNFNNDILNKINWKEFLNFIMNEIADKVSENNEVP